MFKVWDNWEQLHTSFHKCIIMCAVLEIDMHFTRPWIQTSVWLKVYVPVPGLCVYCWSVIYLHLSKSEWWVFATAMPVSHCDLSLSKNRHAWTQIQSLTCKHGKILISTNVQMQSIWYRHPLFHTEKFKPQHSVMMTLGGARRPHDVATDDPDPCCVCEWVLKLRLRPPLAWEARQWAHMDTWLPGKCQNRCTVHLPGVNATPARAPETMSSS